MVFLRFAPSPTGALHLGGLRTALLNHLVARKLGGKWILRIEDTDKARFVPGSVENIRSALDWAGLHYDYGPGAGGPHEPYFQSSRLDLYHSYANQLLANRHAYRCFCSPSRLQETKSRLQSIGSPATYDRACWHLTEEEVARRVKAGESHVIRFYDLSVPDRTSPVDIIFGAVADAHGSLPTDPILLKSDLYPTYHLASVVDDIEMRITHVLRGEEWLLSLPLHLDIYACLGTSPPLFAHLPLLLNPDGSKMSKRKGDVQVADYMDKGWEPEAVLNWLALVGWGNRSGKVNKKLEHGKSVQDVFTVEELQNKFLLSALTSRRGILDPKALKHLNKEHIRIKIKSPEQLNVLANKALPVLSAAFPQSDFLSKEYAEKVITVLEARLWNIMEIPTLAPYFFIEPDWATEAAMQAPDEKKLSFINRWFEDLSSVDWEPDTLALLNLTFSLKLAQEGCKSKEIMALLRYALTGMRDGPNLTSILQVLGKERTLNRLRQYVQMYE